jgi:hypothetical protein
MMVAGLLLRPVIVSRRLVRLIDDDDGVHCRVSLFFVSLEGPGIVLSDSLGTAERIEVCFRRSRDDKLWVSGS